MKRLVSWTTASVASVVGWWLGSFIGLFTALFVSMIFFGVALYYANRLVQG